jgi:hypothetical protein
LGNHRRKNNSFKKSKMIVILNAKPSDTYEGLKTQFFELKRLLQCMEVEVDHYRKRISEFKMERIIELEAELESQKEMNAILTEELELKQKS